MATREETIRDLRQQTIDTIRAAGGRNISVTVESIDERNERTYNHQTVYGPAAANGCRSVTWSYQRDYEIQIKMRISYIIAGRRVNQLATSPWFKVTGELVQLTGVDCPPGSHDIIIAIALPNGRRLWTGRGDLGELMVTRRKGGSAEELTPLADVIRGFGALTRAPGRAGSRRKK